jgi:hypothetical protein
LEGFEPVAVAPGLVLGDRPPQLHQLHAVPADQFSGRLSETLWLAAGVAAAAGDEASTFDAARCSSVVLNAAHVPIVAK